MIDVTFWQVLDQAGRRLGVGRDDGSDRYMECYDDHGRYQGRVPEAPAPEPVDDRCVVCLAAASETEYGLCYECYDTEAYYHHRLDK